MKNIKEKIEEAKKSGPHKPADNSGLPKLRPLKNIPNWCMSYPDFYDKIDEIWDDWDKEDNRLFIATLMYFITGDEDADGFGPAMIKAKIKDLYHE
jgi:hypothetical protein